MLDSQPLVHAVATHPVVAAVGDYLVRHARSVDGAARHTAAVAVEGELEASPVFLQPECKVWMPCGQFLGRGEEKAADEIEGLVEEGIKVIVAELLSNSEV